jgi:hypothetical protein
LTYAELAGHVLTANGNFPYINAYRSGVELDIVNMVNDYNFSNILAKKYKYVVLGNSLIRFSSTNSLEIYPAGLIYDKDTDQLEDFSDAFRQTVDFIVSNGAIPVFITGLYDLRLQQLLTNDINCDYSRCGFTVAGNECEFDDNYALDVENEMDKIINSIKENYPQTIIIDIHSLLCQNDKCSALIDGYPLYRDIVGHITPYASHRLGEMYLEKYGNPFTLASPESTAK